MKKVSGIILTVILIISSVSVFANYPDMENDDLYSDASDWAMEEVTAAYEIGLIPEKLANENLTENVTRAEFAAITLKLRENLTGEKGTTNYSNQSPFTDIQSNPYYSDIIDAYDFGITNGISENTFSPDAHITREQMATMLTRALSAAEINVEPESEVFFSDNNEISDYAKDAVNFMAENEIINGVGDNKFAPKATATREQAILIAYRNTVMLKKETVGNTLRAVFTEAAENGNIYEIAESLVSSQAVSAVPLFVEGIEEGFLAGFDNTEITGFKEGFMISPMIGSIPFVCYVFELENEADTDAFIEKLETSANLRWNICVRAEEMVTGKSGNKVFFVMCNKSLE